MRQSQDADKEHDRETQRTVEGVRCPHCSARRLLFGGDRENPWRCIECGEAFRVPDGLFGEKGERDPVEAPCDAGPCTDTQTRRPGIYAGEQNPVHGSEIDAPLPLPNAWMVALEWPVRLAALLLGLSVVVLGAHGLYVYLNSIDGVLRTDRDSSDLFLAVDVPSQFDGVVNWCSLEALGSWVVPVLLVFSGGLVLWVREHWLLRSMTRLS